MKKISVIVLLAMLSGVLYAQQTRRVLFIGNSYTYTNNLPLIISNIASSMGDSLIYDSSTPGGYTLYQHLSDSNTIHKIMQGGWDYVVLQEQSQQPSFDGYSTYDGEQLCKLISQYNPCARKLYYMTWGRKHGDALNCPIYPPSCTYEGMDSNLRSNYLYMAYVTSAEVSPVGAVWRNIITNHPSIELYDPDESHPSVAGSYAGACSFYSLLFRRDPSLSNYDFSLTPADAATIRNAAKAVAFDSLAYWDFGDYQPMASFGFTIEHGINEVKFINQTSSYDYLVWDFGDGDTSTVFNPIHNYATDGIFHATLTVDNCDLGQMYQNIFGVDISFCSYNLSIFPDSLVVCPGTVDTLWTQSYDTYQWLDTYGDTIPGETNQFYIPTTTGYNNVVVSQNGCYEISPSSYVEMFTSSFPIFYVMTLNNSVSPDSICLGDTVMLILATNKPVGTLYYQWLENGIDIPGATDDTLYVLAGGNYIVKAYHPACPSYVYHESLPQNIQFVNCNIGIEENSNLQTKIFPNPARDQIRVDAGNLHDANYTVTDVYGRIIKNGVLDSQSSTIFLTEFSNGIYYLQIQGKKAVAFIVYK